MDTPIANTANNVLHRDIVENFRFRKRDVALKDALDFLRCRQALPFSEAQEAELLARLQRLYTKYTEKFNGCSRNQTTFQNRESKWLNSTFAILETRQSVLEVTTPPLCQTPKQDIEIPGPSCML